MNMSAEERSDLEDFCVEARCFIEGIESTPQSYVEKISAMTDEDLRLEADFLDDMLYK